MNASSARLTIRALLLAGVLLLVGCAGSDTTATTTTAPAASEADAAPTATADTTPTTEPATAPTAPTTEPTAEPAVEPTATPDIAPFTPPTGILPVRIAIPSIGVDAPTIDLSLAGTEPEVPVDFDDTGWYTQTRLPGELGPAVIAGHIDSRTGPAVFARLDELVPGDQIEVFDEAGDTRTFEVVDAAQYPKGDLPDSVFGFGEPAPELRLITCGGTFDAEVGHYRDNYVVFARLVDEPAESGGA